LKKDIKITIDQVTEIIILSVEHARKKYPINYKKGLYLSK